MHKAAEYCSWKVTWNAPDAAVAVGNDVGLGSPGPVVAVGTPPGWLGEVVLVGGELEAVLDPGKLQADSTPSSRKGSSTAILSLVGQIAAFL